MMTTKKIACLFAGLALCSMTFWGCSSDQEKKEEKKTMTVQEQMGKDAAQALQKPMDEARKAAAQVEAKADQAQEAALPEAAEKGQEHDTRQDEGLKMVVVGDEGHPPVEEGTGPMGVDLVEKPEIPTHIV